MNVENRPLFESDNLDIHRGLDSETIALIYLAPPALLKGKNEDYEEVVFALGYFSDAIDVSLTDTRQIQSDFRSVRRGCLHKKHPQKRSQKRVPLVRGCRYCRR